MAELKTKATDASVTEFIAGVDEARRDDCKALLKLMKDVTGEKPKMWGASMVGFGKYRYKYETGREGEWFLTGFAPRKNDITLYVMSGFPQHEKVLSKLGKYKTGKSCLYVKRLADIDVQVLRELLEAAISDVRKTYGP